MSEQQTNEANAASPAPAEPAPPPVAQAPAPEKKRGGRRKAEPAPEPWPRAGESPTSAEIQRATDVRTRMDAEKAREAGKTPWPNFNAPPVNPMLDPAAVKAKSDAIAADKLVLKEGFRYYKAKRNCRNGKFRMGRVYALPEPQPSDLFEPL